MIALNFDKVRRSGQKLLDSPISFVKKVEKVKKVSCAQIFNCDSLQTYLIFSGEAVKSVGTH